MLDIITKINYVVTKISEYITKTLQAGTDCKWNQSANIPSMYEIRSTEMRIITTTTYHLLLFQSIPLIQILVLTEPSHSTLRSYFLIVWKIILPISRASSSVPLMES